MSKSQLPLSDVLSLFALEATKPTAALVDEYRARYPEYADAIADFALQLVQDALVPEQPEMDPEYMAGLPSDVVMAAISNFQNLRFHAEKESGFADSQQAENAGNVAPVFNPFNHFTPPEFKKLARECDLSVHFIVKLRDRQIVPDTIPAEFTRGFASTLKVSPEVLMAHLSAKPSDNTANMYFKTPDKPVTQPQQSFEDAVRSSLSPEQQERILNLKHR